MADWSELPADLLHMIAKALGDFIAFVRLRAACLEWRSCTSELGHLLPPLPPTLCLMLSFDRTSDARSFYRFADGEILTLALPETRDSRIVGCTDGWLVLVDPDSRVHLLNPLTRSQLSLPKLTTLPEAAEIFELEDLCIEDGRIYKYNPADVCDYFVEKAILIENTTLVVSVPHSTCLACARPGDNNWILIEHASPQAWFIDMQWHRGCLYAVDVEGEIWLCNIGPPMKTIPLVSGGHRSPWYLVESSGDLLLVNRVRTKYAINRVRGNYFTKISALRTEEFIVYKVDFGGEEATTTAKLIEIKDLGEVALILGTNQSMSISTRDFPCYQANCIYFTARYFSPVYKVQQDRLGNYEDHKPLIKSRHGEDFGVFDLKDGRIRSLPCYEDNTRFLWPPPIWFMPKV